MRGTALGGKVEWEETWWEASDWSGLREMGAQKAGTTPCASLPHDHTRSNLPALLLTCSPAHLLACRPACLRVRTYYLLTS